MIGIADFLDRRAIPVPESGCWLWTGGLQGGGYGCAWDGRRKWPAHRLAYEIAHGPIPHGLVVCHRCDVRTCINPNHLFLGTQRDNIRDAVAKGRIATGLRQGKHTKPQSRSRGEKNGAARLTWGAVLAIRSDGRSQRAIARDFGVAQSTISAVKRGQNWSTEAA